MELEKKSELKGPFKEFFLPRTTMNLDYQAELKKRKITKDVNTFDDNQNEKKKYIKQIMNKRNSSRLFIPTKTISVNKDNEVLPSKTFKKSLTISPEVNLINIDMFDNVDNINGLKSIEIALAEIYLDCNNFNKSFIHIKKALNLLKGGAKNFRNLIESKLLQKFLEKVENFFTMNEKEDKDQALELLKEKRRETFINRNREMSLKTVTEI